MKLLMAGIVIIGTLSQYSKKDGHFFALKIYKTTILRSILYSLGKLKKSSPSEFQQSSPRKRFFPKLT